MNQLKVGVIAGTPVDTEMGVTFLKGKNIQARPYSVSPSAQEQSKLQVLSPTELYNLIKLIVRRAKSDGMNSVLVYCNSLSAAVDMKSISLAEGIHIVTPLDAYKYLVKGYNFLGLMAANNQSCAGIEKTIQETSPNCEVVGLGILPLVQAIETKRPSEEISKEFALETIINFFEKIGAEALILGCTHFTCLTNDIVSLSNIRVIDPSEIMYDLLLEYMSLVTTS